MKTCKCVKSIKYEDNVFKPLEFYQNREYQVDVYPLFYKVYPNGGYEDFVFLNEDEFKKDFLLID